LKRENEQPERVEKEGSWTPKEEMLDQIWRKLSQKYGSKLKKKKNWMSRRNNLFVSKKHHDSVSSTDHTTRRRFRIYCKL